MRRPSLLRLLWLACLASALPASAQSGSPSAGWRATCEAQLPATVIEVRTIDAPLRHDHTQDIETLGRRKPSHDQGEHTLGLTEMQLETHIQVGSQSLRRKGEALACMRPQIVVTLKLDPHRVWVASEFAPGSCAYRHIFAHEMRHVRVNQETLETTAQRLREGMRRSFGNKVYFGRPDELQARLRQHVNEEWLPWVDSQMKHTLRQHRDIDTPEEYERNRQVCGGAIARVLDRL